MKPYGNEGFLRTRRAEIRPMGTQSPEYLVNSCGDECFLRARRAKSRPMTIPSPGKYIKPYGNDRFLGIRPTGILRKLGTLTESC